MKKISLLLLLGMTPFLFTAASLFALEVHVGADGSDSNAGTKAAPFATIKAAQQALRSSGVLGKEDCTVLIHAGKYRLDAPLLFTPNDSGSEKYPVTYRSEGDGEVVITGAQPITAPWEPYKNGIYRAHVEGLMKLDQFFVNGSRQILARYPDQGAGYIAEKKNKKDQRAGNAPYEGCTADAWSKEKAATWADPTGAFMHGMHPGLWGSQHYEVLGKKEDGSLNYQGGWQNNRSSQPHQGFRMIENVFEELNAPGEWYHDAKAGWIYYMPASKFDMASGQFEGVPQIRHLLELYGEVKQPVKTINITNGNNGLKSTVVKTFETTLPVKHIHFNGIRFNGTARTFMETMEPLLRSDWSIYRGGAVHLRGTEGITIENCRFEELGGNVVFVDGYNRGVVIRSNCFLKNGASDVNFVGSPAAVRDPLFGYTAPSYPVDKIDPKAGPMTEEYPADCLVEDNLMTRCGRVEKQVAGVNMSMSSRITVRHNTISHTPRAAINVCDGTWGGHLIEWNDCFETVLETHDHGAFNGWGRDRIWHGCGKSGPKEKDKNGKPIISYYIEKYPDSPRWDAYQPTIIRNNRLQCDHGWDIDLDDGCTNYEVYNNLCLSGGLKTREGYYRVVTNNVILGGGYTCNVPFPKPTYDVCERNILWGTIVYNSSRPGLWGGVRNNNFVHNPHEKGAVSATSLQQQTADDADSLYGNAQFLAPEKGDFQVAGDSPALKLGFKNFPMMGFGVVSEKLKVGAGGPTLRLPAEAVKNNFKGEKIQTLFGASFKTLNSEADLTATGMFEKTGTLLIDVPKTSPLSAYGFESDDVVLEIDGKKTKTALQFIEIFEGLKAGSHMAAIWRDQKAKTLTFQKQ